MKYLVHQIKEKFKFLSKNSFSAQYFSQFWIQNVDEIENFLFQKQWEWGKIYRFLQFLNVDGFPHNTYHILALQEVPVHAVNAAALILPH